MTAGRNNGGLVQKASTLQTMNHFPSEKVQVKHINLYDTHTKKVASNSLKVKLPSYRTSHCTSGMSGESSIRCDKTLSSVAADNSIVMPFNKPEAKPVPSKQFNTERQKVLNRDCSETSLKQYAPDVLEEKVIFQIRESEIASFGGSHYNSNV